MCICTKCLLRFFCKQCAINCLTCKKNQGICNKGGGLFVHKTAETYIVGNYSADNRTAVR